VVLKRSWAGEVRNISVLIAIGVGTDGFRQILGVAEGEKEDLEGWRGFLRHLKDRGLKGIRLIISDACRGLVEAAGEVFPNTDWQRCVVHFYRNVFSHVPNGKVAEVARMLKAIHAQESRRAAQSKATEIVARLKEMKLRTAAELVEQKVSETMTYYAYPSTHWRQLRTTDEKFKLSFQLAPDVLIGDRSASTSRQNEHTPAPLAQAWRAPVRVPQSSYTRKSRPAGPCAAASRPAVRGLDVSAPSVPDVSTYSPVRP
jgi:hypothetical protein